MAFPKIHPLVLVRCWRWMGWLAVAGWLTGCVASRERVEFELPPQVNAPLAGQPKASLRLGRFKDSRPDARWYLVLFNPQNANPLRAPQMIYCTNNSVAGIVHDGVAAALNQNGFKTFGPTNEWHGRGVNSYQLCGDIQSAGCQNIQRLFARSLVKTWVTVRLDLVDQATGLTVWHDSYTGQDTTTNYSGGEHLMGAFASASDDVIRQLVTDRTFRNYFQP
jgi:hypothetical protein